MASLKALCLAGVASLAMVAAPASFAHAADLLPPMPQPVFAPPPAPVSFGGFYLRGDVGVGINDLRMKPSSFDQTVPNAQFQQASLDDSGIIDAGVGYKINNYLRVDVTGEYRTSAAFRASESYTGVDALGNGYMAVDANTASIRSIVGLVNGYVDVGTWYGVTPFAGAGVGVANVSVKGLTDVGYGSSSPIGAGNSGGGIAPDRNQTNFAWALMAGLDFAVTPNLALELGYRYLHMGTVSSGAIGCFGAGAGCTNEVQHYKLASNDIRLGFRYMFTSIAPPPIIARY